MSITFPRAFPLTRFQESQVFLQRRQMTGDTEGGDDLVIDRGQPVWLGTWTTNILSDAEAKTWSAWRASMKGGINNFLGFDPQRAYPQNYPGGVGMPGGATGTLSAIGGANDLASLAGFGAGLKLAAGDHVSIIQSSSRYSLHEVLDALVTFDGTGAGTVQLDPAIPSWVTTAGASVNIVQACAKFRLLQMDGPAFSADQGPRPGKPITIKGISTQR